MSALKRGVCDDYTVVNDNIDWAERSLNLLIGVPSRMPTGALPADPPPVGSVVSLSAVRMLKPTTSRKNGGCIYAGAKSGTYEESADAGFPGRRCAEMTCSSGDALPVERSYLH